MNGRGTGHVEDYTTAFLGVLYLLVVMTLTLVWGVWGYGIALAVCAIGHVCIRRLGLRRAARDAEWDARVEAALARARAEGRR